MEARQTLLRAVEKLEGFAHKLPQPLQRPILHELTPLKDLFLRQRAPRLVLAGDSAASSAALFNAIFSAPVAQFQREDASSAAGPASGWQDFSHLGHGVLRLLDTRGTSDWSDVPSAIAVPLGAEPADIFLYLATSGSPPADRGVTLDRLEQLLDAAERAHSTNPCVVGVVVDAGESRTPDSEMESARLALQADLSARPRIARHLAPTAAVSTFMRFRLDGSFDPESDRRQNVSELVNVLVAELPDEARLEMARLSGARDAQARLAQSLVKSFTALSGALGAQPIPFADMPFLVGLQITMVAGIIYISGNDLSSKLATEFLGTMGVNVGLGLAFREGARAAARAATKLLLPGLGNVISGAVAAGGTYAFGRAAIAYYIEGASVASAKALLREYQRPDKKVFKFLDRRKTSTPERASVTKTR